MPAVALSRTYDTVECLISEDDIPLDPPAKCGQLRASGLNALKSQWTRLGFVSK